MNFFKKEIRKQLMNVASKAAPSYLDEIFISVDAEFDGQCPGHNSMLSIGAAACDREGYLLGQFEMNLKPIPGGVQDPLTMEWWKRFPESYARTTCNQQDPAYVMAAFTKWIKDLPGVDSRKILICRPSGVDFTWLYYYWQMFTGHSPVGFKCLDIQSYACAVLCRPYHDSGKSNWPSSWDSPLPHTHVAVEDAFEQLDSYLKMRAYHLYGALMVKYHYLKESRKHV